MITRTRAAALSLATAGLLAASLPAAPAASAATSASCPSAASTRLVTSSALGDPASYTQLWLYTPTNDRAIVCFVLPQGLGSGAIVVDYGASVTPPKYAVHGYDYACAFEILTIADPVPVRIAYGRFIPTSLCITVAGKTAALTVEPIVGLDTPGVEVWRDGTGSVLDIAACSALLVQALADLPGATQAYHDCTWRNERIL